MKFISALILFCICLLAVQAQQPGDTIKVSTFNYTQTSSGPMGRDSVMQFPDLPGITYEKILMKYNMRCKNGLVSPGVAGQTNIGCGEWDYTCNTYIMDSTRTDSTKATHPSHIINGFNGNTFNYTTLPTHTYYRSTQQEVINTATISEISTTIGTGNSNSIYPFNTQIKNSKSQYLFTATELLAAGFTAGNISGLKLNITNAGDVTQFLRIRIKPTTASVLDASTPDIAGFTEHYYFNTALVNGVNTFNFYNNYAWNGTDNLIVEFSFSNPSNGISSIVLADTTTYNSGLITYTNDYNYELTGNNALTLNNANLLNKFSNEITVSFWSNGNAKFLPSNTSIVHANSASGAREINIHHPWSNSNIYWDCGNAAGYDRINALASTAQIKGEWGHWAFTKNTSTGTMNIYYNGNLWLSGTAKTLPIEITNLLVGVNNNNANPYFGNIDELSIWNKELSATDIQAWMNKTITSAHPNYANLLAYYPFNDGNGNLANDASSALLSAQTNGVGMWRDTKGVSIFKQFTETNLRPQITFVQGTYMQTITPIIVLDSIINNANTTYGFSSNGLQITAVDTNTYYQAGYTYVYDFNTNAIVDSVWNATQNTINVTALNYFRYYPAAYQIMSFVTPYGINLNLGMQGKTWTFDVTDFAPILKGKKRMYINGGGERQEDMDIQFWFIVGTPPRPVMGIQNIWRVESVAYTNIINDAQFEPRTIALDANAKAFKVRTAITGHGQEGEFIPRQHFINVNGGATEYAWDVWKRCGENPVYPQGGTWIYDRAGWCPGMATDTREMEITPHVLAGSIATIDYGMANASGDSRYWVSNQLVSYGAASFALDAAIVDIKNPTNAVENARTNPFCHEPIITIQNTGSTALTSVEITYWINNDANKQTYKWNGNLAFLEKTDISLPISKSFYQSATTTNNIFNVAIANPNNGADEYTFNNTMQSTFDAAAVLPNEFIVYVRTNSAASETNYSITDDNGNVLLTRNGLSNNTVYRDTMRLTDGCFTLKMIDTDEDGIDFWANNDGIGTFRIQRITGSTLKSFDGDFGTSFIYNFSTVFPTDMPNVLGEPGLNLYPNPATNYITISGIASDESASFTISNILGESLPAIFTKQNNNYILGTTNLVNGIYILHGITSNGKMYTNKFIIEK